MPTTDAELASAAHSVNTTGKDPDRVVFNTSTGKPVFATGTAPTAPWVHADGSVAQTPT